jgi:hypothetical protein
MEYADPSDVVIKGVMDTRRGTCSNLATLLVALGWRLGWPVSLALAGWRCIVRFDNDAVWNVEASNTGGGLRVNCAEPNSGRRFSQIKTVWILP